MRTCANIIRVLALLLLCSPLYAQDQRFSEIVLYHHLYLGQSFVYPMPFIPKEVIFHPKEGVKVSWHEGSQSLRFTTQKIGTFGVQILDPDNTWHALHVSIYPLEYQALATSLQKLSLRGNLIQSSIEKHSIEKQSESSTIRLTGIIYEPEDWIYFHHQLGSFGEQIKSTVELFRPSSSLLFQYITEQVQKRYGRDIHLRNVNQTIHITGHIDSEATKAELVDYLSRYFPKLSHGALQTSVGTEEQVEIYIQFIELNKDSALNVGFNHNGYQLQWSAPQNTLSFQSTLSLLMAKGKAKLLSEPNLVARHNSPASLHIGGEIPYELKLFNQLKVEWKKYGIRIEITPNPIDKTNYHLTFDVSVSYPVKQGSTSSGIPAFSVRAIKSEVVVPIENTAILSGFLQQVSDISQAGLPVLSDIPILGHLFKQTGTQNRSTELIVAITPKPYATHFNTENQHRRAAILKEQVQFEP